MGATEKEVAAEHADRAMRAIILTVAVLAGCSTPYQRMGWRGGYREKTISPGTYLVEVRVNGYTSAGTALEYLHRRATELCPAGYDVLDGTSDSTVTYSRMGNSVARVSKPEMSALVACRQAQRIEPRTGGGFFCAVDSTGAGFCQRTLALCQQVRDGLDTSQQTACSVGALAICFDARGRDGGDSEFCFPRDVDCTAVRKIFAEQKAGDWNVTTTCSERR